MSNNNNDETIKSIADMIQMQGDEDLALELEDAWMRKKHELARVKYELERVKYELERVKLIASQRLDRIAVLENKLEDTRYRARSEPQLKLVP